MSGNLSHSLSSTGLLTYLCGPPDSEMRTGISS